MLNKYASQNSKGFILPGETELPDNYPVYWDYTYVVVFEDGEVRLVNSDIKGTVSDLRRNLASQFQDKNVAEIRRCELVQRMHMKGEQ